MSEEHGVLLPSDGRAQGFAFDTLCDLINPTFTMEDVKASAFDTSFTAPKTISMDLCGLGLSVVEVAVTDVRVMFNKRGAGDVHEDSSGFYEYPDYYFEGWIIENGSTYHHQKTRVRCCAYTGAFDNHNTVDELVVQIIGEERPAQEG